MLTRHRHRIIIVATFLVSKLIHVSLLRLTPTQFDLSTPGSTLLEKTIRWDAVYFNSLFAKGPQFEHEWVFGPLWAKTVFALSNFTNLPSLIVGLILSNVAQLCSALVLYEYTMILSSGFSSIALKSSVLFLWSSMGVFGTVAYSENFAALWSIIGLYLREASFLNQKSSVYIFSSIFFTLAFWTRSNCIVLGAIYLYDLLTHQKKRSLFAGILLGIGVLASLYPPYSEFCPGRPWCNDLVPSLYSYAQKKYWNNGFMKYWTPNNLFNFIVASPIITLNFLASKHYYNTRLQPIVISSALFLSIIIFFAHVQIIVRISSFLPLQFWYLAHEVTEGRGQYWVLYLTIWIPLQTILYAGFLPPA